jgi:hypothetical protein
MDKDFETLCQITLGINVELKWINAQTLKEKEATLGPNPQNRTAITCPRSLIPQHQLANLVQKPISTGFSLMQCLAPTPTVITVPLA